MAKTKSQKVSHKGKGKYASYRAENRGAINKMKRILDAGPMALQNWVELNNNMGFLLKRVKKEKPTRFAEAMANPAFAEFAKQFI